MKYWIMMSERANEFELRINGLPEIVIDQDLDFSLGDIVTAPQNTMELSYQTYEGIQKPDNIVATTRMGLITNPKIRAIFSALSVNNIQYFPLSIREQITNQIENEYFVTNIIGKYACIDSDKSDITYFEDMVERIQSLTLTLDPERNYGHIFRLAECEPVIVISDTLKNVLQEQAITGIKIYEPSEFSL